MNCQCCEKQKEQVHAVRSTILEGSSLVLCTHCRSNGHEPRYLVAIGGQSGESVEPFIKNRKYCGKPLLAEEVL